eukprot:m.79683 g.79683  ORF g.79683 m.79683 type:complete len:84 (-) comp11985_c0_seq3:387-638(-)
MRVHMNNNNNSDEVKMSCQQPVKTFSQVVVDAHEKNKWFLQCEQIGLRKRLLQQRFFEKIQHKFLQTPQDKRKTLISTPVNQL